MLKLIAFDLDGTMTQHRTSPSREVYELLRIIQKKYQTLMVGAGTAARIDRQMEHFPIDILGNYGMQFGKRQPDGSLVITDIAKVTPDYDSVLARAEEFRKRFGYLTYARKSVEFHNSGAVTIPILGTEADIKDKVAFDPDRSKRRAVLGYVKELFPEYNVFVGGSSSFDMAPKPFDKYYALSAYCEKESILHSEVLYVGDDYGPGGNDEAVYKSDFPFLKVDDYRDFPRLMEEYI